MEQRFRNNDNSEWGHHAAKQMCDETRHLQTPVKVGDKYMTLGDFYDRTPQELISKVMLEEKVFETWYHGRTVLLGDGMCPGHFFFCADWYLIGMRTFT